MKKIGEQVQMRSLEEWIWENEFGQKFCFMRFQQEKCLKWNSPEQ